MSRSMTVISRTSAFSRPKLTTSRGGSHFRSVQQPSLQRKLHSLARGGILRRNADGNRVYFRTDPDCPFLSELRGIILKTVGLGNVLQECLDPPSRPNSGGFRIRIDGTVLRAIRE